MKKVKVAVLGYGHLGKWHCQKVQACAEHVEFVAIVEKFPASRKAASSNHPNVKVVEDIKEVLEEIDAAVVVTPTTTHFELVKFLLENNKHVFCEKPVCSNDNEAKKLKEIASNKSLVVQIGHSERFHEAWQKLRDQFRSLPTPYSITINRVAPFKGRATDVDVIQDLAIHDLDLLMFLFDSRPLSIKTKGYQIRTDKYDHATISIQMENECDATIVVGRNATKEVRSLEVISKSGMITVDLFSNKISIAIEGEFPDGTFVKEENYSKRDHLLLEHQHFYSSILDSKLPVVSLKDGTNAVHLVDCSLKSIKLKTSVEVIGLE